MGLDHIQQGRRGWFIFGLMFASGSWATDATPTFVRDIAPILATHCAQCHRRGQIAAQVDLLSYEEVRSRSAAVKQQVQTRAMPPWPADPDRSLKFRNDARLDQPDIDTIVAWVDGGAPRGDGSLTPPPFTSRWPNPARRPDMIITLPVVNIPANGVIPYTPLRVEVKESGDRWIAAMQFRPGNPQIMHHMGITEVESTSGLSAEQIEAFRGTAQQLGISVDALDGDQPAVRDPENREIFDMLGIYTPGSTLEMYPPGTGKLLKGGGNRYLSFNVHYTANGTAQRDHSKLALWFLPEPPLHQLFRTPTAVASIIANGRQLLSDDPGTKAEGTDAAIPPIGKNEDNYELVGMTAFASPLTIYQLQPHAHMRAKDFTFVAVYPEGHELTLLTVPQYDFHWQLAYELQEPLTLPAGSKLIVTAHYDNSVNNPHLRELGDGELAKNCGPDKEAYFRRENQSWDEMFTPLIQYSTIKIRQPLRTVEVVGCPSAGDARHPWSLVNASAASTTTEQSTSAAALRQISSRAKGSYRYRLLGAGVFDRQLRTHQRLAVRGMLIAESGERSLNVTSVQVIPGSCR